jgi:putative heme-binding domain-containing protein
MPSRRLIVRASSPNMRRRPIDREHGAEVFKKQCAACHRLNQVGHVVGPDLAALTDRSPAALLTSILDPSKEVDARYLSYTASTADGRTLSGMLTSETGSSITLLGQEGKQEVVLRRDIEELFASGKSLMPDGVEKEIPPSDMADLLAYLAGFGPSAKRIEGNLPGLVEAGAAGAVVLTAAQAEIYGNEITYEQPLANIGYWHDRQDHVAWSFVAPAEGEYDVRLEYSCDDGAAGNTFEISVAGQKLAGKIEGTGGWANYRQVNLGKIRLGPSLHRLVMRPTADIRGALADVKRVVLEKQ